ncbi:MAG: hypothetical protein ABW072_18700 [Sedimenticola sp.]
MPLLSTYVYEEAQEAGKEPINKIGDGQWILIDKLNDIKAIIDWGELKSSSFALAFAQGFVLQANNGYQDDLNTIYCRKSTLKGHINVLREMCQYIDDNHPNKPLSAWTLEDVSEMLRALLLSDPKDEGQVFGRGRGGNLCNVVTQTQRLYRQGKLHDGFDCQLPTSLMEHAYKGFLEQKGINYLKWRRGGSHAAVPVSVAMLLLADCLKLLKDTRTKVALAYFDHQRSTHRVGTENVFYKGFFNQYLNNELKSAKNSIKYEALKVSVEKATEDQLNRFHFDTHDELSSHVRAVYDACIIIFLTVTGARLSEIGSIKAHWFDQDQEGSWWFKSEIYKTNHGIKTMRSIAGIAAQAADIINRLSYTDKEKHQLPLFSRTYSDNHYRTGYITQNLGVSEASLRERVQIYYSDFLRRVGREIEELCPSVVPHGFRHTWAEFALRRFDGNVLEEIRHHYRHYYGSYYTKKYTNEKLAPEIGNQLEREYLREMIERIAGDDGEEFYGPVAMLIKKRVSDSHQCLTPEEFEVVMKELEEEFVRFVPHEWGYCVLQKETQSQAQCFDKATKVPLVGEGSSFENCSTCIHRLSQSAQREDIERIAISHQAFIDSYPLPSLTKESKKALRAAENILKEMQ